MARPMTDREHFQDLMGRARSAHEICVKARERHDELKSPEARKRQRDSFIWWSREAARLYGGARAVRNRLIENERWRAMTPEQREEVLAERARNRRRRARRVKGGRNPWVA